MRPSLRRRHLSGQPQPQGGARAHGLCLDRRLPRPVDLAVLIMPAKFVAQELEPAARPASPPPSSCRASRRSRARRARACRPSSRPSPALRHGRHGTQLGRLRQHRRGALPDLQPGLEGRRDVPSACRPTPPGSVALIAQCGGMGFSFFDRGRPKEMAFDYIVTTGNEACLEGLDFVEHHAGRGQDRRAPAADRGHQDAPTRSGAWPRRRCGRASRSSSTRSASPTPARGRRPRIRRRWPAPTPPSRRMFAALRRHRGSRHRRDGRHRRWLHDVEGRAAPGAAGRHLHGLGWRRRLDGGCLHVGRTGGAELDAATRAALDQLLPSYGTSQNPVDGTAQAIRKIGYAGLAGLVAALAHDRWCHVVMSARSREGLSASEKEMLSGLRDATGKPILMWSYTLPAQISVQVLSEAGFPLYTSMPKLRAHDARHGRLPRPARALPAAHRGAQPARPPTRPARRGACRGRPGAVGVGGRPLLAAYGIGVSAARHLVASARGGAGRSAGASAGRWRSRCSRPTSCTRRKPVRWRSICATPTRCAPPTTGCSPTPPPCARRARPGRAGAAHGRAGARGHPRHQARPDLRADADAWPRRHPCRGAEGRGPCARCRSPRARRARCSPGSRARRCSSPPRRARGRHRRARRPDGAALALRRRPRRHDRRNRPEPRDRARARQGRLRGRRPDREADPYARVCHPEIVEGQPQSCLEFGAAPSLRPSPHRR